MTFASSSVEQIGFIQEATFGVTPTSGDYKKLRMTGESLNYTISKESSEEINNSRTVSSMIPVTASADGAIEAEISYAEYDPLIEAVLQSSFAAFGTNGVGATFTADITTTTITASAATSGSSIFTNLKKGQFFRLSAPGNANNGKILRVSLTVAPTATVITLAPSTPAVAAAGVALCTVASSRLTNGADQRSFSIERQNSDIGEYWVYKGMTASSWDLSVSSGSRSTMSFNFMGKKAERSTSTSLPGTAIESQAYDIHSGSTGPACYIWVDGAPLVGTFVQSVSLNYDNALRSQEAVCELGAVGIGSGTVALTGTLEVYFANGDLFDKFKANQNVSFTVSTLDDAGNGYIITIPKANLSSLSTSAGGKDQDMMLSIEITGLRDLANTDPTLRQLIFIDRVGASVTP
jgi:hypothetical protein